MRGAVLALLLLAIAPGAGCGVYRWGYEPVGGAREVAVPIFVNKTLRRGYEYSLTSYTRQRILDATPMQLAREGSGAPIVKGTIVSVLQGVVIPNTTDTSPPFESSLSITVSVELVTERGKVLAGGANGGPAIITESESWVPDFAQTADTAADRIMKKLAERIVDVLEAGWGGEPTER